MTKPRASWTLIVLSYPCPTCDAAPGDKCRTSTGNRINSGVHAARVADINHCPRCGARTPADDMPGQLCARCELVRALEVERATKHERENP